MYRISKAFNIVQLLLSIISLIILFTCMIEYDVILYRLGSGEPVFNLLINGIGNGMFTVIFFGIPIIASIICNMIHIYKVSKMKYCDALTIIVIIITFMSITYLPVSGFIALLACCAGGEWGWPWVISAINTCILIPQCIVIYKHDKMLKNTMNNNFNIFNGNRTY